MLAYTPFLQPLPGAWQNSVWPWLMLPLCVAVAIVYKAIKCHEMADVPRAAAEIVVWIVLGMVGAAAVLTILVKGAEAWAG